ncbi:hypothetical protein M0R45_019621 [Rubus argutus]|uniref:EF-hand domain-containing protein n=1 Tax=Rubus argutus TaxID=59490 RepID=A0AAW1X6S9_RUBAR
MEPNELKRVFEMFDRNGDGRISKEELSDSLENLGIFIQDKELFNMIEKIDRERGRNGDGFITVDELRAVLSSMGLKQGRTIEDCKRMIIKVGCRWRWTGQLQGVQANDEGRMP